MSAMALDFLIFLTMTLLFFRTSSVVAEPSWGGLYPRESLSREVRQLDGIWDFRLAPLHDPDLGFTETWYKKPLKLTGDTIKMAVPSSYNDVTQDKALRDHIGWAWYDRTFFIPKRWIDEKLRILLRLGSAHYNSIVYINGFKMVSHEGGHLPIMADISQNVIAGEENLITICVNNTLTPQTIPQGTIEHYSDLARYPPGYFVQKLGFDFFNYAGLHRPIYIYTTPSTYIDDVNIITDIRGTTGSIKYTVAVKSESGSLQSTGCSIKVYDKMDKHIQSAMGCNGVIDIENATLWWPYLMDGNPGYMYKLNIAVSDSKGVLDVYPQKVGIRKLGWNSTSLTFNDRPLYLMGCGKHEDSHIRGKGVDYPLIVKDFSLLKWLGANSFRTSHYPYAEEIMDMADEEGIMVIDECPAVGLSGFGEDLMNLHISIMRELIRRDKNRPSVIMWSVGNEPKSSAEAAENYFKEVVATTKEQDATRPVTCVLSTNLHDEKAAYSLDVILINRYYSWYSDTGHLEVIERQAISEFTAWHFVYKKPVMISEYGAGSVAGIHIDPSFTWSEEYQVDLILENFKAFDVLRKMGFFVGEMIWNFADFATPQDYKRVAGNRKGIFTRTRQPKMAAHLLRHRYMQLAGCVPQNTSIPQDVFSKVAQSSPWLHERSLHP